MDIDSWQRLTRALSFYKFQGYTFINIPWHASTTATEITLGDNIALPFDSDNQLVGSAEQSFIDMTLAGKLSRGKYVGISPCFRPGQDDKLHNPYFMKVELFDSAYANKDAIIDDAQKMFQNMGVESTQILTDEGTDLIAAGIEIGSYGIRITEDEKLCWAYGTGLAEPRFAMVKNLLCNQM